jgi:hypothetical protein
MAEPFGRGQTMGFTSCRIQAMAVALALVLLVPAARAATAVVAEPTARDEVSRDADRGSFARFLDSHPELGSHIQHNPQILLDEGFVQDNPELAAFLEAHPLVKADPRAFVSPHVWNDPAPDFFDKAAPYFAFVCILLAVLWVFRSLLVNRRWSRSAAAQAEIHTKLLDRFGSSQEMLAYMQTDAGRRFLEAGTITLEDDTTRQRMPSLIGRILWSLQSGLILLLVGVGLIGLRLGVPEGDKPLLILGTLALTLGAGFLLSAAVSYVMSKRLGFLPDAGAPAPDLRG